MPFLKSQRQALRHSKSPTGYFFMAESTLKLRLSEWVWMVPPCPVPRPPPAEMAQHPLATVCLPGHLFPLGSEPSTPIPSCRTRSSGKGWSHPSTSTASPRGWELEGRVSPPPGLRMALVTVLLSRGASSLPELPRACEELTGVRGGLLPCGSLARYCCTTNCLKTG